MICSGATAQHPDHDYLAGGVASGLSSNGHSRYWASIPSRGFAGPFRTTRERAQADLDRHTRPGRWRLIQSRGLVHVGRDNLAVAGGVEFVSGPSGPTRYGTLVSARETVSYLNRRDVSRETTTEGEQQ